MVSKLLHSATPASLRRAHRGMALSLIENKPGTSRSDLAAALGFSEMAATRIVRELLSAGLVEEFESAAPAKKGKRGVGRPKTGLRIISGSVFAVGITVSAYHSVVAISDSRGDIIASHTVDNPVFATAEAAARLYATAVSALIADTRIDTDRIVGIGVALSARTDPSKGEILKSEYFGWANDGGRFCAEIRKHVNLPVEIENIANALAIAEMRFGAARQVNAFALVHAATFVGASLVSEGRVVRGAKGISGVIGHVRSDPVDLTCVCGRHDCLNLSATGFGILGRMGRLDQKSFDHARLSSYASGLMTVLADESATPTVAAAGGSLAPTIDNIVKLLGPEMVIITGQLGTDTTYFDGARTALQSEFGLGPDASYRLVRGTIKAERAAALLALHTFFYSDRLDYDRLVASAPAASISNG